MVKIWAYPHIENGLCRRLTGMRTRSEAPFSQHSRRSTNDRGNVMAMPAELNTTVVITLEYRAPDGKVHRRVTHEGGQAVKVANLVGDLLDLVPPRDVVTGETK